MIKAGDAVDLLVIKDDSSSADASALPRLTTEILASNVSVLSVTDENRFGTEGLVRSSTITMLLRSEDLDKVRKAYEEGKIRVELHRETENTEINGVPIFSNTSVDSSAFDEVKSNLTSNADSFVIGLDSVSTSFDPETPVNNSDAKTSDYQNATNFFPDNEEAQVDDSLVSMPSVDDNSDFAIELEHLSADEQTQEEEDVSDQSTLGVLDRESQGNVREEKSSEISGESISSEPFDRALNRQA